MAEVIDDDQTSYDIDETFIEKVVELAENSVRIDKHGLDDAIIEQTYIYSRISEAYSTAVALRDSHKQTVETLRYSADQTIRRKLEEEGAKKLTEGNIEAQVMLTGNYMTAMDRYLDWKIAVTKLSVWRDVYEQRAHMLKTLVELYTSGYYSDVVITSAKANRSDQQAEIGKEKLLPRRQKKSEDLLKGKERL